jgi:hypothetical protein
MMFLIVALALILSFWQMFPIVRDIPIGVAFLTVCAASAVACLGATVICTIDWVLSLRRGI